MNCKKCGSPLGPNDIFCKECGTSVDVLVPGTPDVTPVAPAPQPVAPQTPVVSVAPTQPMTPQAQPVAVPIQPVMQAQPMQQPVGGVPVTPTQPMGTPVMGQPVSSNGKGTNKILLVIAVIAVIAAVAVVLYFTVLKKDDTKPSTNSGSNTQQDTNSNNSNNNSNSQTNENTNSNSGTVIDDQTISHDGFTYQIPSGYTAQTNALGTLILSNDSVIFGIISLNGSYEMLLSNINSLKSTLESQGYIVTSVQEQSVNGKSYIVIFTSKDGKNMVIAYTKVTSSIVMGAEIYTVDNGFGTQYLTTLDGIISTTIYTGADKNLNQNGIDSIIGQ